MIDWTTYRIDRVFQDIYLYFLTTIGIINLFASGFTMFIVATKTPAETKKYKVFLLNILMWSLIVNIAQGLLTQFEAHWPLQCFEMHGLVGRFDVSQTTTDVLATFVTVVYSNMAVAALWPLFFRHVHLVYPNVARRAPSWIKAAYCVFMHVFHSVLVAYVFYNSLVSPKYYEDMLAAYPNMKPVLSLQMFCFHPDLTSPQRRLAIYCPFVAIPLDAAIAITLLALCIHVLRKQRRTAQISQNTYKLQKKITRNLSIITFVPLLMFAVPFMAIFGASIIVHEYSNYVMTTAELVMCIHDLVACIVTLTMYSAYRNAVKEYARRLFFFSKNPWSHADTVIVISDSHKKKG